MLGYFNLGYNKHIVYKIISPKITILNTHKPSYNGYNDQKRTYLIGPEISLQSNLTALVNCQL